MKRHIFFLLALCVLVHSPAVCSAQSLNVAVAANFMQPFKEIAKSFESKSMISVNATFASSGHLTGQIMNGAPYDIFLSADEERSKMLHKSGLAEEPFVYARGQVVLWSARRDLCRLSGWQEVIKHPSVKKIAVAAPKLAPYGAAAMGAIEQGRLWDIVQHKLVYPENIAQAFQYASTGSVDAAFCAISAAFSEEGKKGCYFEVREARPIVQGACVLMRAKNREAAKKFVDFLESLETDSIKKKYGYK
ncbi:MAG TPA: molybdate ABC transporter substrate-binding protein [Desulfomonilaceae bacterium]|nr:molybdate ABC transporter substrate-binding protein [Desulfomonilaceae bacterium]